MIERQLQARRDYDVVCDLEAAIVVASAAPPIVRRGQLDRGAWTEPVPRA
jgi:hypothetical protein